MKKTHLRKISDEKVIDKDTGELIDSKVHRYIMENDTEFYLTYCKVLGLMEDMGIGEVKTLAWLVNNLQFNNNMVSVSLGVKEKISVEMGVSISSVSNALPKLVKKGILYREECKENSRGAVYYIHPEYFWKGDLAERKRKLKYVLEVIVQNKENK